MSFPQFSKIQYIFVISYHIKKKEKSKPQIHVLALGGRNTILNISGLRDHFGTIMIIGGKSLGSHWHNTYIVPIGKIHILFP
jgi:hypothetical protein